MGGAGIGVRKNDSVPGGRRPRSSRESSSPEQLVVAGSAVAALLVSLVDVAEFDLEHRGLDGVHAGVPAHLVVEVTAGDPVGAEGGGGRVGVGAGGGQPARRSA